MPTLTNRPVSPGAETLINKYFPVLDHGFVALIDYAGTDQSIEHAARLSYGKGTRTRTETEGLLRYLKRHRHTTPSEMVELKFHVAMPIFVGRQWVRHRTASINEYSGRYSELPDVFYTPEDWRLQSTTNNQGSEGELRGGKSLRATASHEGALAQARATYQRLLELGVAKEIARIDMPVSGYTQWYWKMDLHNLMHFLSLRCDPHAQYEIRVYADIIAGIVKQGWPIMYQAFLDYQLDAVPVSRMEKNIIATALLEGRTLADFSDTTLESMGLSSREIKEFRTKFDATQWQSNAVHNHDLPKELTFEEAFARLFPNISMKEDS